RRARAARAADGLVAGEGIGLEADMAGRDVNGTSERRAAAAAGAAGGGTGTARAASSRVRFERGLGHREVAAREVKAAARGFARVRAGGAGGADSLVVCHHDVRESQSAVIVPNPAALARVGGSGPGPPVGEGEAGDRLIQSRAADVQDAEVAT